jgi:hypothetical protein
MAYIRPNPVNCTSLCDIENTFDHSQMNSLQEFLRRANKYIYFDHTTYASNAMRHWYLTDGPLETCSAILLLEAADCDINVYARRSDNILRRRIEQYCVRTTLEELRRDSTANTMNTMGAVNTMNTKMDIGFICGANGQTIYPKKITPVTVIIDNRNKLADVEHIIEHDIDPIISTDVNPAAVTDDNYIDLTQNMTHNRVTGPINASGPAQPTGESTKVPKKTIKKRSAVNPAEDSVPKHFKGGRNKGLETKKKNTQKIPRKSRKPRVLTEYDGHMTDWKVSKTIV